MAGRDGRSRAGVCVVRAEVDAAFGILITVTDRLDVSDTACESVLHTSVPGAAVDRLAEFLAAFARRSQGLGASCPESRQ